VKPIRKLNVSLEVSQSIIDAIKTGNIKPGDRLPPMIELANVLNVGISSVREGLKQLQTMGIVKSVQGKGTYLAEDINVNLFLSNIKEIVTIRKQDFADIMEARKIIEQETARLAAVRAGRDNIERLDEILRDLKATAKQHDLYEKHDVAFHIEIARCSGNPVLVMLLESIQGLVGIVKEISAIPGLPDRANVFHENIFEAIRTRKPNSASRHMRDHLLHVERVAQERLYRDHA
jgi:GntR family transcriptional repressor for pyruvate dehydrogenase complex